MGRWWLGLTVALLAWTNSAQATLVTYSYTGGSVAIPNNTVNGVALDINITDTFDLLSFRSITINGSHTWIGDLVMTLTHVPSGRTIDLMRRPGKSLAGSGFGDASNWAGFTFSNVLATSDPNDPRVIDKARNTPDNRAVAVGVYRPTTNSFNGVGQPSFSGESITNLNTTFDPLTNISGIWRLYVQDLAILDLGAVAGYSITLDVAIPEPSSMLLLGTVLTFGGAGEFLRRRRNPQRGPTTQKCSQQVE